MTKKTKLPFKYRVGEVLDVVLPWAIISLCVLLYAWVIAAALDKMGAF